MFRLESAKVTQKNIPTKIIDSKIWLFRFFIINLHDFSHYIT